MLFELAFGQAGSEMRAVNRNIKLLQDIRECSEVILVAMRENYRGNVVAVLFKKIKVRDSHINAVCRFFGKAHSGVEHQHLVATAYRHTVHSKLADSAERNDLKHPAHVLCLPILPQCSATNSGFSRRAV